MSYYYGIKTAVRFYTCILEGEMDGVQNSMREKNENIKNGKIWRDICMRTRSERAVRGVRGWRSSGHCACAGRLGAPEQVSRLSPARADFSPRAPGRSDARRI